MESTGGCAATEAAFPLPAAAIGASTAPTAMMNTTALILVSSFVGLLAFQNTSSLGNE